MVERVLIGKAHAFAAIASLLKVCNHPHLLTWDKEDQPAGMHYGEWRLSGKMQVLRRTWPEHLG